MRTVVVNNRESLVMGQMPHIKVNGGVLPQLGEIITLIPGVNLVDSAKLKTLRENKAFEANFRTRIAPSPAPEQSPEKVGKLILEVDKSIGKDGEVPDETPLAKLTYVQCQAMIAETFNGDMLRQWEKEEIRSDVRREINRQLELMEFNPKGPASVGR
jgi:hypothetical protein